MTALYDIPVDRIDGSKASLKDKKGDVLLVVNVASKCGLTPQYEALEKLHEKYAGKGFAVLGFPANNFAGQEPGSNEEIAEFCTTKFNVQFPMYAKISVRGDDMHPLYAELVSEQPAAQKNDPSQLRQILDKNGLGPKTDTEVMWNFEKFLVDRNGKAVARFAPDIAPDDARITAAIEAELAKS
ncbi:MAG TPA: glutathione peroxidase [Rhizomicrobium sp.]|nr:glutathione peroxidase [Rhizomicrobium sp.]